MLAVTIAALLSLTFDTQFSPSAVWRYLPGYGALILHGLATSGLDHTLGVVSPSLGETFAMAVSVLMASIVGLFFYAFKTVIVRLLLFNPLFFFFTLTIKPFFLWLLLA
jgi:zinc transporter 5/7